jgi:hypothetical protein
MRTLLGLIALALFGSILWGWNAYGENGSALELMMVEVGGLASFITEQLGEASGSLSKALVEINTINTK